MLAAAMSVMLLSAYTVHTPTAVAAELHVPISTAPARGARRRRLALDLTHDLRAAVARPDAAAPGVGAELNPSLVHRLRGHAAGQYSVGSPSARDEVLSRTRRTFTR